MNIQKQLSKEDERNPTITQALEILSDFGAYLQEKHQGLYFFTSELPWSKSNILLSTIKVMRENLENKEVMEILFTNLVILDYYIPAPVDYQEILDVKKSVEQSEL